MKSRPFLALTTALAFGLPAALFALDLPSPATVTGQRSEVMGSYPVPIGAFAEGSLPTLTVEGALDQTAWRITAPGLTTLQILAPLRAQLAQAGFQPLFDCETDACGGFDFRYGMNVLPEPSMHVDLGDFRYFAARRPSANGPDYVSLLVSRATETGYVQITRIGPTAETDAPTTPTDEDAEVPRDLPVAAITPVSPPVAADLGGQLLAQGHVVLDGLAFETGAATLAASDVPALDALADWLKANPQARVTLVGHTDASGALEGNIALSRSRAEAVRHTLTDRLGVNPAQISAEGVGYLSPRATNLTDVGRQQNRRVEAILTSTQ